MTSETIRVQQYLKCFLYLAEEQLNPGLFSPKLGFFNLRVFNQELFNPMVQSFMVKKLKLKSSRLKNLGLKGPGVEKYGVEKSGVEISFNHANCRAGLHTHLDEDARPQIYCL